MVVYVEYLPQANLNGSSPKQMTEDWLEALEMMRALQKKMRELMPHPRDYQNHRDYAAHMNARFSHVRILDHLEWIENHIEAIAHYWHEAKRT